MASFEDRPQSHSTFKIPYPRGLLRLLMRLPIILYRFHLGWLLGKRFLLLEHRGRRSGMLRQAVIEVVDYDPQTGAYVVAAAWGARSDWFQNILVTPNVHVTVSTHRFPAVARELSQEEAARHLHTYSVKHPLAFQQIGSWLVRQSSHDTQEIIRAFVESIPFVELFPYD